MNHTITNPWKEFCGELLFHVSAICACFVTTTLHIRKKEIIHGAILVCGTGQTYNTSITLERDKSAFVIIPKLHVLQAGIKEVEIAQRLCVTNNYHIIKRLLFLKMSDTAHTVHRPHTVTNTAIHITQSLHCNAPGHTL